LNRQLSGYQTDHEIREFRGNHLEQTILKLVGWEVGTEVENRVTDDSLVL
jgi:hypothetical protein